LTTKVLHIIDSLGMGGAEMLLVSTLPHIQDYKHVLVTLNDQNDFENKGVKIDYVLKFTKKTDFFGAVRDLKKIIKKEKITSIARFACPCTIPMVTTIHCPVTDSIEYRKKIYRLFDRLSFFYKKTALIGVSQTVLDDYTNTLGLPANTQRFILYNCIDDSFLNRERTKQISKDNKTLRLVSVGSLKDAKNYPFLLKALKFKASDITIDIIGEGEQRDFLLEEIKKHNLPIKLLGKQFDLNKILLSYDAFVLPSTYEGFGIAVAEAAAIGLPLILSSIPVFREITDNNAVFFDPYKPEDFNKSIEWFKNNPNAVNAMSLKAQQYVKKISSRKSYLTKIGTIYQQLISGSADS
jgi:glycosyltransferase involved in cell wall biosynthesis